MSIAVSVIIPVYNKSEYAERCAESLVSQSFGNFEAVFVDDGSTDNSVEICERIARCDSRFRVVRQKNAGVAAARNTGIRAARGKYLAFVDPDDTVESDFLYELFTRAEAEKSQIVCCGYTLRHEGVRTEEFLPADEEKQEILLGLIEEHPVYNNMWTKLYLREFVLSKNIFVPEGIVIGEDALFNMSAYAATDKITNIKKPLYNYFVYSDSAMNTRDDERNRLIFLERRCELTASLGLMNEGCEILAKQIYENNGNIKKILKNIKIDDKLLQAEIKTGIYPLVMRTKHIIFRLKRKFDRLTGRRK